MRLDGEPVLVEVLDHAPFGQFIRAWMVEPPADGEWFRVLNASWFPARGELGVPVQQVHSYERVAARDAEARMAARRDG